MISQRPATRPSSQRGVTLIELMIAITLVALMSAGMLTAMRVGLLTLQKTDGRLQANRRIMGAQQILASQIGGMIPVLGACSSSQMPFFGGDSGSLRMVSTYSISGGSRGQPQVLEFVVIPDPKGGVQLVVNEIPYAGPASLSPACAAGQYLPVQAGQNSFVLADRLLFCRIRYQDLNPDLLIGGGWNQVWNRSELPAAVRVEMEPLVVDPARLPTVSVTVPLHINRNFTEVYGDEP